MDRNSLSLLDDESVEAWIANHGPDGFTKLQTALNIGRFAGARAQFVSDFIARRRAAAGAAEALAITVREERAVAAAERSARWAGWSISIAMASLALSAWVLIREVL